MASTSKNGSSLTRQRDKERDESWKTAPSRETTHDHPQGRDEATRRVRKRLENAPGAGKSSPRQR